MNCWIAEAADLAREIDALSGTGLIALDTEFIRERTFHPELALVQLSAGPDRTLLIDPLALEHMQPLDALLADASVTKVMHSASEDLQALARRLAHPPAPLFDTQIAASLAGLGAGMGYQRLVAELLGEELDKGETRSDWTRRPLSDSQIHYAAEDVRHLHALHAALESRLRERGMLDWLREDCERMIASAADEQPDPHPHLSVRSAQRMNPSQQALLRRLLLWRDQRARDSNRPRGWIIDNELVVALATTRLADRSAFEALLDARPRSPRRDRDTLWREVQRPLDPDETDIPLAQAPAADERDQIKRLQQVVGEVAARHDIAEGLLASRRHLETYLRSRQWPDALEGWRRGLLEPELAPVLP